MFEIFQGGGEKKGGFDLSSNFLGTFMLGFGVWSLEVKGVTTIQKK